ncbi:MAG: 50S ribosomal protein L4 [Candidatus Rokuibacteriota bacterium]
MPSVPIVDGKGKSQQTLELSADVFGGTPRIPLLHQAVVKELAARRAGTHSTRGRSEVRGGGRKPWKQKGTGRARQGSIRATQWKGGGKPFGPRPRKYDKRLPTEMRRAALRDALAAKLASGEVSVVDALGVAEAKTRALTSRLKGLGIDGQATLLVVSEVTEALARAARNVPWLSVEPPGHASVYQVIRSERVVFERAALQALEAALHPDGPRPATETPTPAPAAAGTRDRKTSVRRGGSAGAISGPPQMKKGRS